MRKDILFEEKPFSEEGEQIILVNEDDDVIGHIGKLDAHLNGAQLHRAFSLFILSEDNELLIQRRSEYKPLFPYLWSNTVCSHPAAIRGEQDSFAGVTTAIARKTEQELGLKLSLEQLDSLVLLRRIVYSAKYSDKLTEKELDYVVLLRANKKQVMDAININLKEVSEISWVSMQEMDSIKASGEMSPWCNKIYTCFFRNLWENSSFSPNSEIIFI